MIQAVSQGTGPSPLRRKCTSVTFMKWNYVNPVELPDILVVTVVMRMKTTGKGEVACVLYVPIWRQSIAWVTNTTKALEWLTAPSWPTHMFLQVASANGHEQIDCEFGRHRPRLIDTNVKRSIARFIYASSRHHFNRFFRTYTSYGQRIAEIWRVMENEFPE
jgi:hypothetical protein